MNEYILQVLFGIVLRFFKVFASIVEVKTPPKQHTSIASDDLKAASCLISAIYDNRKGNNRL